MPKYERPAGSPWDWIVRLALLAAIILYIWFYPYVLLVIGAIIIWVAVAQIGINAEQETLAAERSNEDIGDFARSFNCREIDTWVIRAVYEQTVEILGVPKISLRASDNLFTDLCIDPEDLELDLAEEISQRTGRTLDNMEDNPYFDKVNTVKDLVLFFDAQPRKEPI